MRTLRYFGSQALLLVLGCFSGQVLAQNKGYEPTFLSPNAASLLSYNQSSVNGYTGQIGFSIPIWNKESRGIGLNLSLGYNSGGNKVEDIASWVGLGWNLSGLPMISRQVRGLPDEEPFGYMGLYEGLTMKYFTEQVSGPEMINFQANTATSPVDSEADVFHLSINNFSGRFFYDQVSGKFLTEEMSDIRIVYDWNTQSFFVTDDSGIVYTFSIKETSQLEGAGIGKPTVNTWLPSRIENSNKTSNIQFEYSIENQLSYRIGTQTKYIQFGPLFSDRLIDEYSYVTSLSKSYLPSVITFDGGKITFVKSSVEREDLARGYNLSKIVVSDLANNIISQSEFNYSYRTGTGSATYNSNKWMFLESVNLIGSNSNFNQKYRFSYDTGAIPPSRISYAQDWWGYYNGATSNLNLVGPAVISAPLIGENRRFVDGVNRLVNEQYSQFGILKKVEYPTGGSSEYIYENNETADMKVPSSYDKQQLFLSAEEMWQDPEPVFPNQKSFVDHFTINNSYDPFLNNNQNGGVVLSAEVTDLGVPAGTTGASLRIRGLSASNSNVSHLFYESFKNVYFPNGEYEIKAEFNQNPPNYMNFVCGLTWYTKRNLTTNKLGGLRIRETKDYSANGTIAFSKKYYYSFDRFGQKSSGRLFGGNDFNNVMYLESHDNSGSGKANSYARISSAPSTQPTAQNGTFVGYDRVYQVMTSNNDTTLVKYDYINLQDENSFTHPYPPAQTFAVQNGKIQNETIYSLKNNILDSIQKTENYYDLGFGNTTFYSLKRVDDDPAGVYLSNYLQKLIPVYHPYHFQRLKCNLLNTVKTTYSPIGNIQSSTTNFYNALGDLIQSDQSLSTGRTTRYKYIYPGDAAFTGANENARLWMVSNNVVSKPVRTKKYEVNGSSEKLLEEHISYHKQYGAISQNVFIEKAEVLNPTELSERITFPSYDNYGNLQEIKKQENATVTYLWGYGGQYPIAEIRNATYAEVALVLTQAAIDNLNSNQTEASMETLIKAASDKLRNDSRLAKAMVTTYTYKPLVGMTSKTDARGITEYYKYDGMQRLQAILDHLNNVNKSFDYHYRSN
ncbi:MAG: hypothetical protein LBE37_04265 [Sphingobacterium sp.]|jgi:hypothetical protein|nr:hypothetical protein [Sphingobacterium sp.]